MKDLTKLEQAVVKAALLRYADWVKAQGPLKPWGHPQAVQTKRGWNLLNAVKQLYEARRAK